MEKRPTKWHEDFFIGSLLTVFYLMLIFNGFSYLTTNYILDGNLSDKMSKQNGIIAIISLIENDWWKYPLIVFIAFVATIQFKTGILKLLDYDYYLSFTNVTEFDYPDYFPFAKNMNKKIKSHQHITIKKHDLRGNVIKEDFYQRGKLSRRKTFKYSNKNVLIEENRYHTINLNLEHEQRIIYEYEQEMNLKSKKIVFDFYRYGKQAHAGYHKYYYENGFLNKEEIFNHNDLLQAKFIWQKLTETVVVKLRYERKKNDEKLCQINRETFDGNANRIKLELNFSPTDSNDFNFSSIYNYEFDADNLIIKENNINYEYLKDSDGFWYYKKTSKDGKPISCMYRNKKSR
jgi:hypothetical protein